MTRRTRVYIAGPYSSQPFENTARAIDTATALLERGYAPFVPHLSLWWDMQHQQSYGTWLDYGLEWLFACDVVMRIAGTSPGADQEVNNAITKGLRVYYSLDSLCACEPAQREDK